MRRILTGALASLLLVTVILSSATANATIDAQTNTVRAQHGLKALTTSSALTSVAVTRSHQISTNFAHPTDWQWMFNALGGCYTGMGENIAWWSPAGSQPASWPVSAWVASPEHLANILGVWDVQGSATYVGADGRIYGVQLFAKRCASTPAPAPQPAAAPRVTGPAPVPYLPNTAFGH